MAKYQSALTGAQMDSALATMNQVALVSGVIQSDGDGTFSEKAVDTTPTASSTNLITSGAVKEVEDTADSAMVVICATEYSSSSQYSVGTYVRYNSRLYVCNTAITTPEAWTAAHWTITSVGLELNERVNKTLRINDKSLSSNVGLTTDDIPAIVYGHTITPSTSITFTGSETIYLLTNPSFLATGHFAVDTEYSRLPSAVSAGNIIAPAAQRTSEKTYDWYIVVNSITSTSSGGYTVVGTKHSATISSYCSMQYVQKDDDGFYVNY